MKSNSLLLITLLFSSLAVQAAYAGDHGDYYVCSDSAGDQVSIKLPIDIGQVGVDHGLDAFEVTVYPIAGNKTLVGGWNFTDFRTDSPDRCDTTVATCRATLSESNSRGNESLDLLVPSATALAISSGDGLALVQPIAGLNPGLTLSFEDTTGQAQTLKFSSCQFE